MKLRYKILILAGLTGVLSISNFNCAQDQFSVVDTYSAMPTGQIEVTSNSELEFQNKTEYSLLAAQQLFSSMLKVTDQVTPSNAQLTVFNTTVRLLAASQDLDLVNGPMVISTSNLAGSVCDGLLTRESATAAANRKFFPSIDFTRGPASLTSDQFLDAADSMAVSFWGHSLSMQEAQALETFRIEFMGTLSQTETGQGQSTREMILGSCTAMLSSFDFITY
jgi:hypothetical protein